MDQLNVTINDEQYISVSNLEKEIKHAYGLGKECERFHHPFYRAMKEFANIPDVFDTETWKPKFSSKEPYSNGGAVEYNDPNEFVKAVAILERELAFSWVLWAETPNMIAGLMQKEGVACTLAFCKTDKIGAIRVLSRTEPISASEIMYLTTKMV